MTLRDWIIDEGAIAAVPVWGYGVFNQWSSRPGATGRMLNGCVVFLAIILSTMAVAYMVGT